jgi:hypothetical protein
MEDMMNSVDIKYYKNAERIRGVFHMALHNCKGKKIDSLFKKCRQLLT